MLPKTPSQDSHSDLEKIWKEMDEIESLTPIVKDSIESYREAAKSDSYLFGDYDAYSAFEN